MNDEHIDLLEWAWVIISNAGEGNWSREHPDWQKAAAKWRDEYHRTLAVTPVSTMPDAPAGDALATAEWLVCDLPQPPGHPTAVEILRAAFAAARAEGAAEEREACARLAGRAHGGDIAAAIRARAPSSGTEAQA